MSAGVVVVGAGHCGGQLVAALRAAGYGDPITLIGEEPFRPYQRPPLSKAFLAGKVGRDGVFLHPEGRYAELGIELIPGTRVAAIARGEHAVELDGGGRIGYERLVLATGARPRRLAVPGDDLDGVLYLRDLDDAERLRARLEPGARLVVAGGGYIGLEVAACAVQARLEVTVLEAADRVMHRVVGETVARRIETLHAEHGVRVLTGAGVEAFAGDGHVRAVRAADGTEHPADLVVVGVGIEPNVELAAAAGLAVDDGIVVDDFGRTLDPAIYAAGDCTRHPNALYARSVRLECVQNAIGQGRCVAAALAGESKPYRELPWFWSDQYDQKLQIAGLAGDHDETAERGEPDEPGYTFFYLRDGRVVAAETIGAPRDHLACRKLIAAAVDVDPAALADPSVPLASLAAG